MAIPAQMITWVVMDNPCGLNNMGFAPQPQKPQEFEELMMYRNPFLQKDSVFESQRDEIDLLINAQNERLRMVLREQRNKEVSLVMKRYECLIKQRDEDLAKAANRNMELENHVKRMEFEVQKWQRVAEEKEGVIASLNNRIQEVRESGAKDAEDAESCFLLQEQDERWDQETRKMVCRCCNSRKSCVIMLPCRHLCSCKYCDDFLDSCPLCNQVKKFSIEALV